MPPSKILQGRCVKPSVSFHGRNKKYNKNRSIINDNKNRSMIKNKDKD